MSDRDVFFTLGHGLDVVAHVLEHCPRYQIGSFNLSCRSTCAAYPYRDIGGLNHGEKVLERRQVHSNDVVTNAWTGEGYRFVPQKKNHIVTLFPRYLGCHERQRRHGGVVGSVAPRNDKLHDVFLREEIFYLTIDQESRL